MSQAKLTLYIDKETTKIAKKFAMLSGKSISTMVKEYFISKNIDTEKIEIPASISKWIGIINNDRTYKELRDLYVVERLKKYENIN